MHPTHTGWAVFWRVQSERSRSVGGDCCCKKNYCSAPNKLHTKIPGNAEGKCCTAWETLRGSCWCADKKRALSRAVPRCPTRYSVGLPIRLAPQIRTHKGTHKHLQLRSGQAPFFRQSPRRLAPRNTHCGTVRVISPRGPRSDGELSFGPPL